MLLPTALREHCLTVSGVLDCSSKLGSTLSETEAMRAMLEQGNDALEHVDVAAKRVYEAMHVRTLSRKLCTSALAALYTGSLT